VEQHTDWPRYEFPQLVNGKSDLVVLANVVLNSKEKAKDKDNPDSKKEYQISTLEINETIYGSEINNQIKLLQSVDQVKNNKEYLLFLDKVEGQDFYVVSDGNSQIEVKDNKFTVHIPGIEGDYDKEKFKAEFSEMLKKVKSQ
jgi:hypothetical protein